MDIRPDKRHLAGGLVGAVLLTAYLVYSGMSAPSEVYFKPAFSSHLDDSNYGTTCVDCHAPFKRTANDACSVCHPGGSLKKPGQLKIASAARDPRAAPQSPAAAKFHKAVAEQACVTCHVEHRETPLVLFLRELPAERAQEKSYPENVHAFIPESLRGEQHCTQCHEPAELERLK